MGENQSERDQANDTQRPLDFSGYLQEVLQHNIALRKEAEKIGKPVLITGYVMDLSGIISTGEGVPLEIANDDDWAAFMHHLAGADVFFTGMAYLRRAVEALQGRKSFQDILFPFSENSPFGADALNFANLGSWRQKNGMSRSPDIVATATSLEKYRQILESSEFGSILQALKAEDRQFVIVLKKDQADTDSQLIEDLKKKGVDIVFAGGRGVVSAYLDWLDKQDKPQPLVIANTTGPRVFQSFLEAAEEKKLPFELYLTVVQNQVSIPPDGKAITFIPDYQPGQEDWMKRLQELGFEESKVFGPFKATNKEGEKIKQSFYHFRKKSINPS